MAQLPLRDGVVDTYYSGGVLEHFEAGPHEAIAEADRVLRRDGVFLVSVPYLNPLRRVLAPFRRPQWRKTRTHSVEAPPPHRVFFQYAYTPAEFGRIVSQQGFRVISRRGYSILWGLYELPVLGRILQRAASRGRTERVPNGSAARAVHAPTGVPILKRLVVSEDDTVAFTGWAVHLVRWLAANMMMYECVPSRNEGS